MIEMIKEIKNVYLDIFVFYIMYVLFLVIKEIFERMLFSLDFLYGDLYLNL